MNTNQTGLLSINSDLNIIQNFNESNYTVTANETNNSSSISIARIWLQGILLTVIGFMGFVGNSGSIIYFSTRKRFGRQFEALMLWLAVWDNIFITCALTAYALPEYFQYYKIEHSRYSAYTIPWLVPILQIASTCNILFTIAISLERYLVICKPLFHRARVRRTSTPYIISLIIIALIYNLSKFFELETIELDDELKGKFLNWLVRMVAN